MVSNMRFAVVKKDSGLRLELVLAESIGKSISKDRFRIERYRQTGSYYCFANSSGLRLVEQVDAYTNWKNSITYRD